MTAPVRTAETLQPPDRIVVGLCANGHIGAAVLPNARCLLTLCNECGEDLHGVRYQLAVRRGQR